MLPSDRAAIDEAIIHLSAARAALGKLFPQMRGELTRGINWLEKHKAKYPVTFETSRVTDGAHTRLAGSHAELADTGDDK